MNWTETFSAVLAGTYVGVTASILTLQLWEWFENKAKESKK